jgi:hypothetical protein
MLGVGSIAAGPIHGDGARGGRIGDKRPTCRLHRRQAGSPYWPAGRKGVIAAGIEDDEIEWRTSLDMEGSVFVTCSD